MKAVVILGGNMPSKSLIEKYKTHDSIIVCCDSGANCIYKYGMNLDYLIGDFDSIDSEALKHFKSLNCKIEKYPPEKNSTDSEIAVNKCVQLGITEIVFLGFFGSRMDHILGNIGLLKLCLDKGIKACLVDENNYIGITNKSIKVKRQEYKYISFLPYCSKVSKVTLEGSKYALLNYDLYMGDSRTISNEFSDEYISVKFESGVLLIIMSSDKI